MTSPLLFNATIAVFSISAALEIGILDRIAKSSNGVHLPSFCQEKGFDKASVTSLIFSLACFQIVHLDTASEIVSCGDEFEKIYQDKGYFLWMAQGYGKFLLKLPDFLITGKEKERACERNSAAIASSGKDYGAAHVDAYVKEMLSEIVWSKIADLGCGSAHRLIEIVQQRACLGCGIEIEEGAIRIAEKAIAVEGLEESIKIFQGDVRELKPRDEFKEVDLITSFFMGHDLWPKEKCIDIFRHFKSCFPQARYFLFCDTFRSNLPPHPTIPTFTLGFEFFHALMGQYIPSLDEWREVFQKAGWTCRKEVKVGIPFTTIFLLTPD